MKEKVLSYITLVLFFISSLFNFAPQVSAQEISSPQLESTQSAQTELTPTPTQTPKEPEIVEPTPETIYNNPDFTTSPINQLEDTEFSSSAVIANPIRVRRLGKTNYKGDEKISIIVEGAKSDEVEIKLFNVDGNEVPIQMEKVNDQDPAVLRLSPPRQFKAGRYRLVITDPSGSVTTQDFTWGVLAINPNKSIYLPNETANLAMAVLDETGIMVCDADVELKISNAELGINDTLSTSNGKIIVNPECAVKDFVEKPDYETTYQVKSKGIYDLNLTATTKKGSYSIADSIEVKDSVSFDVERLNATRLFPPITYSSVFNIIANEDFEGTITETVPDTFAISSIDGVLPFDQESTSSAQVIATGASKDGIPNLHLPYQGDSAINQKFGSEIRDPLVAIKYSQFGLIGHDGIDFDLPEGEAVLAVDDGEVVRATENGDYGTTIVVQHSWGRSYYGHLSKMTAYVGKKVNKGWPLGMSGSTGLSTGPHLHFGIKPNKNDANNGYYGKINPLPYLGLESEEVNAENIVFSSSQPESFTVKVLTWHVSLKKGDKLKLGYGYKVPNVSPQFYLLGPLKFTDKSGETAFQEARQWQLAVDADGSGANSVSPTTGSTSSSGNTYTFTFDPSEDMSSGGVTIQEPSADDWTVPQGTAGVAGYTTAVGTGNATVADVLNNADTEDPTSPAGVWNEGDIDMCGAAASTAAGDITVDTSTKKEGSGSIKCALTTGTAAAADNNDDYGFIYDANQDWSTFCGGSACTQIGYWINAAVNTEAFEFDVNDTTDIAATPLVACAGSITAAATWEYYTCDISGGTLTTVRSFGFSCTSNTCNPFDGGDVWVDEFLIGPGVPTFSGTSPWLITTRFLDLAATETVTVTYGSGGGASGVTNSASAASHQFTTQSKVLTSGTYTSISAHPTVTLSSGPTNDQLMRHGAWFSSGAEQPFTF